MVPLWEEGRGGVMEGLRRELLPSKFNVEKFRNNDAGCPFSPASVPWLHLSDTSHSLTPIWNLLHAAVYL